LFDPAIKYGGGNEQVRDALIWLAHAIATVEDLEVEMATDEAEIAVVAATLKAAHGKMTAADTRMARDVRGRIDNSVVELVGYVAGCLTTRANSVICRMRASPVLRVGREGSFDLFGRVQQTCRSLSHVQRFQ
jgi:hypothetical protein